MSFKPNALYYTDGYKPGHRAMLAPGTTKLYGTWIPRSIKHAPKGITKILSLGQQLTWRWLHDTFEDGFFNTTLEEAQQFGKDMTLYLGMDYDAEHFDELYRLGYLPMHVKSLPEGIETDANIPHMTFINTRDGYAWLTLFLETIVSSLSWKTPTSGTLALQYRRNLVEWVMKTDPDNAWLIPYLAHDFSARGLDPFSQIASGLGHASSFRGSDTLVTIPAARYYYGEPADAVIINSVNASEHSVSTTKIFTVGEQQMLSDWMKIFPKGILSVVSDTFDLWVLITVFLPALKEEILARDGKLVIRPDSGDPVDIICGAYWSDDEHEEEFWEDMDHYEDREHPVNKGVIELLWDIFGGTTNAQGYKVLDPHIGAIYGDSINLERQVEIYRRLEAKGFAATNIVLGVGSFTYQFNTRDTFGFAAKGSWFIENGKAHDIYKDPVTDDGTKKSYRGLLRVDEVREVIRGKSTVVGYKVKEQCTEDEENGGVLETIYHNGTFTNTVTFTQIRERIAKL